MAHQVEVINASPIPASVKCSVKSKQDYFTVQHPEFMLAGGAKTAVSVTATFLEAVSASAQLAVSVVDGQDLFVSLKGQVAARFVAGRAIFESAD